VIPPAYRQWLMDNGLTPGGIPLPEWSAPLALEVMGANGIETGILSVSAPGVHDGDDAAARSRARQVNEFVADVVRENPTSFGMFATLTLPDVDGAIEEAAYAFDELGADGVVLLANNAGTYLGDPSFEPLFEELGRRRAVVFVHPNELPGPAVPGVPSFALDFLLDTARAALNLATSGTLTRHPELRIILSHAGGFLPYVADRVAPLVSFLQPNAAPDLLRQFWFDVAVSSGPSALPSLLAFADPSRITYGSDSPFAPAQAVARFRTRYETYDLPAGTRVAIDRANAEKLFPRLAPPSR
jgi:predicted TIM-barrel fold metal-dependent hydrolase